MKNHQNIKEVRCYISILFKIDLDCYQKEIIENEKRGNIFVVGYLTGLESGLENN